MDKEGGVYYIILEGDFFIFFCMKEDYDGVELFGNFVVVINFLCLLFLVIGDFVESVYIIVEYFLVIFICYKYFLI